MNIEIWSSPESILRPLLFITYINDFPLRINYVSETILFADDIRVIISSRNFEEFCSVPNLVLSHRIKWFVANNLVLNLDKTSIMKFITNNSSHSMLHIGYKEKCTEETVHTQLLDIQIDSHINWKNHIEEMIPQLSGACYAVILMVHTSNINTEINLLCIFSFYYKIWNKFLG